MQLEMDAREWRQGLGIGTRLEMRDKEWCNNGFDRCVDLLKAGVNLTFS